MSSIALWCLPLRRSLHPRHLRSLSTSRTLSLPSSPLYSPSRTPLSVPSSTLSTPPPTSPEPITYLPLPRSQPYRRGLLLLSFPSPPHTWPSHLDMAFPLLSAATVALRSSQIGVNAIYDGTGTDTLPTKDRKEVYPARLVYADGKTFVFSKFSMETLKSDAFVSATKYQPDLASVPAQGAGESAMVAIDGEGKAVESRQGTREILVCTHGSRDCRCSERGGPLVDALRREVERRGVDVVVREIAHVGGHKFAANALLLPSLDMMSNLAPSHAPALISHVLSTASTTLTVPPTSPTSASISDQHGGMWSHWRGRIGVPESTQAIIWDKLKPNPSGEDPAETSGIRQTQTKAETVKLKFRTFEGELKEVDAELGENLLQVGKRHDLPAIEGVCGGNLECATCHVYLLGTPPIPDPSEAELDMLGYAIGYRDDESRLGCQVVVTRELAVWTMAGGVVQLPRY